MMGFISGATIMAPIIAGALFAMRPSVAIAVAIAIMKKKLKEGIEPCCICRAKSGLGTLSSS